MLEARRLGLDLDQVRGIAGCRLHDLSCRAASQLIQRLCGDDLPNAPGRKPRAYPRARKPGVAGRMIQPDHCAQITRLLAEYFPIGNRQSEIGNPGSAGRVWLFKNFKVSSPAALLIAQRAGEVISVLKTMLRRRHDGWPIASAVGDSIPPSEHSP